VGLAFDSAGKLYVANSNNGTVEEFTSQGIGSVFANIDTP
jgi:DNA-binding beta-propeller fold protein YncE